MFYYSDREYFSYRSRNIDILEFSNREFYENKINLISPPKYESGVEVVEVRGLWSLERTNEIEANALIKKLIDVLKLNPEKSVGVITFNVPQKQLLQNFAKQSPHLTTLIAKHDTNHFDELFFIQNIENIQGDERDIILFSIGYAEREQQRGKYVESYGFLSNPAGENRLNVAITRARQKNIYFKSISSFNLKFDNGSSAGEIIFMRWLKYLEMKKQNSQDVLSVGTKKLSAQEEIFYDKILKSLKKLSNPDLQLNSQIELGYYGKHKYVIDYGIYDNKKQQYVLGIELDGAEYHSNSLGKIKDSDIERQSYIESRGWKIIRFWYRDTINQEEDCLSKIIKALADD